MYQLQLKLQLQYLLNIRVISYEIKTLPMKFTDGVLFFFVFGLLSFFIFPTWFTPNGVCVFLFSLVLSKGEQLFLLGVSQDHFSVA